MKKIKKLWMRKQKSSRTERIFAASFDGDCSSPAGAYAYLTGMTMILTGFVASVKGDRYIKNRITGPMKDYEKLSEKLSRLFIRRLEKDIKMLDVILVLITP